ncbi:MAG: hypothetical protein WDM80_12735 [Limisphaerales bacterium]
MSEENKHGHSIIGWLCHIADQLEPLDDIKNPFVAAACGFLFGGIGLGLYLRSLKDFLIPFALLFAVIILGIPTGEALLLAVPFIWAVYGYYRVKTSNANRTGYSSTGPIIDAEVITTPPPIPASQKS